MSVQQRSSGGIGCFGFLTLFFIALKLLGEIEWSWIWVLSPIWLPPALAFSFMLIMLLFFGRKMNMSFSDLQNQARNQQQNGNRVGGQQDETLEFTDYEVIEEEDNLDDIKK